MQHYTADGRPFEPIWDVLQNLDVFRMASAPDMPDCIPPILRYLIHPIDIQSHCYHIMLLEIAENAACEALC